MKQEKEQRVISNPHSSSSYKKNRLGRLSLCLGYAISAIMLTCPSSFAEDQSPTAVQLPDILIKGERQHHLSLTHALDSSLTEKKTFATNKQGDEEQGDFHEDFSQNAEFLMGFGSRGRRFIRGIYESQIDRLRLSVNADSENKTSSRRHANFADREINAKAHLQINPVMTISTHFRSIHNKLELPGTTSLPTNHDRTDTVLAGGISTEYARHDRVTRLLIDTEKTTFDETLAGQSTFTLEQGILSYASGNKQIEVAAFHSTLKNQQSKTTGQISVGIGEDVYNGFYNFKLGVWGGSKNTTALTGLLQREWTHKDRHTIRLNIQSQRKYANNKALYLEDYTTKIQTQLLPATSDTSADIAFLYHWPKSFDTGISFFSRSIGEYIYYDFDPAFNLYTPDTLNRVRFFGGALNFDLKHFKPWLLSARYIYEKEDHKAEDFTFLPFHSRHQGEAELSYKTKTYTTRLRYHVKGRQRNFIARSDSLRSYGIVHLRIEGRPIVDLDTYIDIQNIFDKKYELRLNTLTEGRLVRIGVRASF